MVGDTVVCSGDLGSGGGLSDCSETNGARLGLLCGTAAARGSRHKDPEVLRLPEGCKEQTGGHEVVCTISASHQS
ncbi:ABC transporter ATP-binding protein [Sesbania bispinosa]|nr:ABC transporter ATP-binding protein [Sesbania bispinosa]